jgi:hypothetical protein
MKKIIIIQLILAAISGTAYCQLGGVSSGVLTKKKTDAKKIVDETISNPNKNFKSKVTDLINGGNGYYQALIKNGILKQGDGEIQVKSTIYGIIRIFDSTKQEDHYFKKLRWARNTQFGLGAVMGEGNKVNSFGSSLTIALVNKRLTNWRLFDDTISTTAINDATSNVEKAFKRVEDMPAGPEQDKAFKQLQEFGETYDFGKLQGLISDEEIKDAKSKWTDLVKKYDNIKAQMSGAPLLTYRYEGNYGDNKWTKLNNQLEFLVGVGKKKDSVYKYDFYAGLFYEMSQDTLNKIKSLNRNTFTSKIGINCVLWKDKVDESSIIEAFGGAEYQHISKGRYTGEKTNNFKLDLTLSFRLAKNLYLPFQLKYNQSTGRFEGYIDLKFDVVNIFK